MGILRLRDYVLPIIVALILPVTTYIIVFHTDILTNIYMNNQPIAEASLTHYRILKAKDKLPPKVNQMLEKNEYKIYVLEEIDDNEYILGQTIYGLRIILIKDTYFDIERTFYHECGHVIDDESAFTYASSSNEFIEIYNEEKYLFKSDGYIEYYISTPREYFASAFAEYMLNPQKLKENTPKTYEYIDKHVK